MIGKSKVLAHFQNSVTESGLLGWANRKFGKNQAVTNTFDWYDEIDPLSFYEKHFEETFLSKMHEVYPDFIGLPFSLKISTSKGENSKPDLAMVRKDYKEWYVIEAEMGRHSWDGHVEKQVRVFSTGYYAPKKVAKYMFSKNNSLDSVELEKMIDSIQPKVMVIVNEPKPKWEIEVKKYNSYLSVFQIYKGLNGYELYRISGDTPFIYRDKSHSAFVKGLSNTMEIYTPTFIAEPNETDIIIYFRGKKTKWKVLKDKAKTYIVISGRTHFLQLEKKYILYISNKNEYYLDIN
ncbi:hypothetical protein [Leeuwenhoekiella blandensis]|uniref:Uncharacterized protein n=1 Tax=Leeuwenhoekiella blandensis (strain CECT 7118 / CCUG 51940 / KCTC 22103 / MED217) TaxID=398720 RepID=A3XNR1_LEEBM|nr:hypothetical protein [Leeuwenhoekiella blandensis]EAQ48814.1 hypothetical protein MED217_09707 [Leeuwenhoekiella blandensis MED217]